MIAVTLYRNSNFGRVLRFSLEPWLVKRKFTNLPSQIAKLNPFFFLLLSSGNKFPAGAAAAAHPQPRRQLKKNEDRRGYAAPRRPPANQPAALLIHRIHVGCVTLFCNCHPVSSIHARNMRGWIMDSCVCKKLFP